MYTTGSIAIVGIGGIFPGASDLDGFWDNILGRVNSAREAPEGRWLLPPENAFDSTIGTPDRAYSTRACFVDGFSISDMAEELNISRSLLEGLDPMFHLALFAGHQAFNDAITDSLDRERTGLIIGNIALPTEKASALAREYVGRTFEEKVLGKSTRNPRARTEPLNRYVTGLPAGILAKTLGLGLGSFTLDAACASSLYALKLAADELLAGRAEAMLTGGVSRPDSLYTQIGFSQLRALSPTGTCAPFCVSGNGLVVGEGAGMFMLKRTEDALRDGDHIYSVIKGIGLSNDIEGKLLAPSSEGQLRAMRAAYEQAGWHPQDVDLIECHGTGTPVGDRIEIESLKALWGTNGWNPGQCAIGSVKSNIGHLLTAAGAAALAKVLIALKEKTIPPTANIKEPHPDIELAASPFRIPIGPESWEKQDRPRRAAVSAFGFGGINAHVLLEEWLPEQKTGPGVAGSRTESLQIEHPKSEIAVVGMDACFGKWRSLGEFGQRVFGGEDNAEPVPMHNWFGADESSWFKDQGLDKVHFRGFTIDELLVLPDRFRIPPMEFREMLPQQILMLQVAAGAISDARLTGESHVRTGLFIGLGLDLNTTNFQLRWWIRQKAGDWAGQSGLDLTDEELETWSRSLCDAACPALTADRTTGSLGGIVASRIAREFHIGGPSFTIAGEESSGIRALEVAVRALQQGSIDIAVAGAVDLTSDIRSVLSTHAGRAFSASAKARPFCTKADGTIIGEGAAAVVLKCLDRAIHDNDRIYAVIRGIGAAAGGGGEQFVPEAAACRLAMKRAHADAGTAPGSISYIETHGSGHPAEDRMEARALTGFYESDRASCSCSLGSVKPDIGHAGAAAGMASFVKTCLCLHHEIIPPLRNHSRAGEGISPCFFFPKTPRYWIRNRAEGPRRATLNCFSVDGNCTHVVLESREALAGPCSESNRSRPLATVKEALFAVEANHVQSLTQELDRLAVDIGRSPEHDIEVLAHQWAERNRLDPQKRLGMSIISHSREEFLSQIDYARRFLADHPDRRLSTDGSNHDPRIGRVFFSPTPMGREGEVAFVFPGSGNHYPEMGRELSVRWPETFRNQDAENEYLKGQFPFFWSDETSGAAGANPQDAIFCQVALGTIVSDLMRSFGVRPDAAIGYSLGETAALFSMLAWTDRDEMLRRMNASALFTDDLAGPCRAAQKTWNLPENEDVDWVTGVIDSPAGVVEEAIKGRKRVYLMIVNTPRECVVGGDRSTVKALVEELGCIFFALPGVSTVHCEVALQVEKPYRDLHLFKTIRPEGIRFYSCASGRPYEVNRENAADSILEQALNRIDFPKVIRSAYEDGVRIFLEMGPGNSCTRMIGEILENRPHTAVSACFSGRHEVSSILNLIGQLIAERVPVALTPLYGEGPHTKWDAGSLEQTRDVRRPPISIPVGRGPFSIPAPPCQGSPRQVKKAAGLHLVRTKKLKGREDQEPQHVTGNRETETAQTALPSMGPLIRQMEATGNARAEAHETYLRLTHDISRTVEKNIAFQMSLIEAMNSGAVQGKGPDRARPLFDRAMCMEFAIGSIEKMLGPEFAPIDSHPTRVRLPDEPLMLVDRIMSVEGEPLSLKNGRVVTEHDIHPGAWYLAEGRIPTCIAVEAGQADLFLSGYLGIDFKTKGLAVYRLLDAVVTFHRELPCPGTVIRYDIRIENFFRQGDTYLFGFSFEGTVNGEPLLSMKDGCAGFFSAEELAGGKGIVHTELDRRPVQGVRPADWEDFVPMSVESYDEQHIDALRNGDLKGCFGDLFEGLGLGQPLGIPGGQMKLVDRVLHLDPEGGRFGLGIIRAEADIHHDDWFLTCHFVDDRVMPGTLMYECCLHTLRAFLLRLGWVGEQEEVSCMPVPGVPSRLKCRGQVIETTKKAVYEISIKEIGYRPEPYAVADALIYADGKPIVEMSNMSIRFSGLTREKIKAIWKRKRPPLFDHDTILAFAVGKPSVAFGEPYRIFDKDRVIARLPGPPYQFLDRITKINAEPWKMVAGGVIDAQYDVPPDAWYFKSCGTPALPEMPFAVLLEVALQPCGWLAAYIGSALTSEIDLSFRNLGGTAVQYEPVLPVAGTLTTTVKITSVSSTGGMIIQNYDFEVRNARRTVYKGDTYFGFFTKKALADQVGLLGAEPYQPDPAEIDRSLRFDYPAVEPFPGGRLRMVDRVELFIPDGGPEHLGFIRGVKDVIPDEWFFKAHFYQDPVWPGSLGLESFLQLVKVAAAKRWGRNPAAIERTKIRSVGIAPGTKHTWIYRGQVIPSDKQVTIQASIGSVDDKNRVIRADGFLMVDGRIIYQMNDFSLKVV